MRAIVLLVAIIVLSMGRLVIGEDSKPDQNMFPDHLIPIRSFMHPINQWNDYFSEYDRLLAKHLFVTDGYYCRMLVRPSFSNDYCLSVSSVQQKNHPVQEKRRRYILTVTTAVNDMSEAIDRAKKSGKPIEIQVKRVDREISGTLAEAISRVWTKALLLTRYPATKDIYLGADGTTYQFSVISKEHGPMAGETWSPESGLPLKLTNIGLDLVAFARQDDEGKKLSEEILIGRLKEFESAIPKLEVRTERQQ